MQCHKTSICSCYIPRRKWSCSAFFFFPKEPLQDHKNNLSHKPVTWTFSCLLKQYYFLFHLHIRYKYRLKLHISFHIQDSELSEILLLQQVFYLYKGLVDTKPGNIEINEWGKQFEAIISKSTQTSSPQDRALSLMGLSPFACCETANQIDKPKKTRNPTNPNPQTSKFSGFFISQPPKVPCWFLQCRQDQNRFPKTTIHQDIKETRRWRKGGCFKWSQTEEGTKRRSNRNGLAEEKGRAQQTEILMQQDERN